MFQTKESGTWDPQNFPGFTETWAHVQATVGPQLLMLNRGTGVFFQSWLFGILESNMLHILYVMELHW